MNDLNHIYKVGNLICRLREEKGLSQSELGNMIGVTNKAISRWENGRGYPDVAILLTLASTLDITVDELLKGELLEFRNNYKNINTTINYNADKKILIRFLIPLICFAFALVWMYLSLKYTHELYNPIYFNYFWTMFLGLILPNIICSIVNVIVGAFVAIKIHKRKDIKIIIKVLIVFACLICPGIPYFAMFIYLLIKLFEDKKKFND